MGSLLLIVGFFGLIFGVIRLIRSFFKRSPKKPELLIILGTFIIIIVGGVLSEPSEQQKTVETKTSRTQPTKIENKSDSSSSEKKNEDKNKQKQALISFTDKVKQDDNNLANLKYNNTQTIEVNDNKPTFSEEDLSLANKAWEKYGDLDKLNRATSAEAMLNKSLMPTTKRGDISNVKPTGWHNKKIDNGYLYNRSHLIGYALSGENDNWKNLITGTAKLNNPEMLRYEMDIKYYLEKSKNNYVRYSVTPVFRGNELLARGVHMMARSIDSDDIKFNVYIFNVQDGVTLNYTDGTSQLNADIEKQKEEAKKAKEKAAAEAQRQAQEQAAAEAQRQAQEQQPAPQQNQNGATGFCKDGSPASGDPSARGKANSCYGHGGWQK